MPIYEYQCQSCGHHLEALQQISEGLLRKCPECGRSKLKRLISPPVFRLKGSGWYETDFKSDKESRRNIAEGHKEEPAAEAKPASTDTASKPGAEAKATDSKAADSKPAESKPAAPSRRTRRAPVGRKSAHPRKKKR